MAVTPRHYSLISMKQQPLHSSMLSMKQKKQAQGYNKRVKGTHLCVGDRVLIANKGDWGGENLPTNGSQPSMLSSTRIP